MDESMSGSARKVEEGCTNCGICVKRCAFLKKHGTPGEIASKVDIANPSSCTLAFECSLCALCDAVCPEKLELSDFFLELRRASVNEEFSDLGEYKKLIEYERKGISKRYTWYALPEGCETIIFPGCALSGSRAGTVIDIYKTLATKIPNLGIVLDCCTKPSHDLGRQEFFEEVFGEMRDYLVKKGVKQVLTGCPNCYKVFEKYGGELETVSLYQKIDDLGLVPKGEAVGEVVIHDPCVNRFDTEIQSAVRSLAVKSGISPVKTKEEGLKTNCCGEGGGVPFHQPEFAENWRGACLDIAEGKKVVTYCAGCAGRLSGKVKTAHILDIFTNPKAALAGDSKVATAPMTYRNRLFVLKKWAKTIPAKDTRERNIKEGRSKGVASLIKPLLMLAILGAIIYLVRASGFAQYLEVEKLRQLVEESGKLGPLIYLFLYAISPPLFLPALPITVAGGILFGPIWGVVYVVIGSNIGAAAAFIISRYFARDWVSSRLSGPKWKKLDERVEREGWKVVAFTRLIPLFPFNLLNYAFGLTTIPFSHYVVTSFICMLPGTIAYVVFSSSLLDVFKGEVSVEFVVGVLLIACVSAIPFIAKKFKKSRVK